MKPALARIGKTAAAITALGLVMTSCSAGNSNNSSPEVGNTEIELSATTPEPVGDIDHFSWRLKAEPFSLSPLYTFDWDDNTVASNLCESLLRWNADLATSPGLAESFENPAPQTWIYKIREGVKFHDGSEMTARDVVASLKAHQDPKLASFWQSSFQNVKSIQETGKNEVTVKLTKPDLQFNLLMAASPGAISSAESLEKQGQDYGNQTNGVNCTGPFKFDSWQAGEKIELSRFEDYWDPELKAKSESMTFVVMNDANSAASAMQTGEIDGGWRVGSNSIEPLKASGPGEIYFGTSTTIQSLIVSDLDGPLGDVRVRQALSMAINRQALSQAATQGIASPATSLTPQSVWAGADEQVLARAFEESPNTDYDIERAKELIAEAGAEGAKITLASTTYDPTLIVIAQGVSSAGAEIGLDITIDDRPANTYTTLFSDPSAREGVDMFVTSWYLSVTDPLEMYAVLRSGEFSNYGEFSDENFDALTNKALETNDPAERLELAAEVQAIANEQLPWIPLLDLPTTVWQGERITGVEPSINFLYYPWAAKIGKAE
jgi:peptide/nickel transport system substrate-binding protein